MKRKFFLAAFFLIFSVLSFCVADNYAYAAKLSNGQTCVHGTDCQSGFCGVGDSVGSLICMGSKANGESCSTAADCQSGFCGEGDGYGKTCEEQPHKSGAPVSAESSANTSKTGSGALTNQNAPNFSRTTTNLEFTNPLEFTTVEDFLQKGVLVWLQRIIVVVSLVFIIIGALMYITSAGDSGQTEKAKKAITASLIGFALGIAAPSFLKEISSVLGWGGASSAAPSLTEIGINIMNFLLSILGVLALVMMIVGSTYYVTAAGDEKRIETGKKIFQYSVLGIIVAMSSMVVLQQIAKFFIK